MAHKILIIEDEPSILKAMGEVLKIEGFETFMASDAERGLAALEEFKPDMILLDLILPGKNGFEVLKELKASPEHMKIPVIILSNLGDEEEIHQGLNLGAVDFLIKADYDLSEVVSIIKKHLK